MPEINERFKWASEFANIQPGEAILEIGCGTGVLAHLLAAQGKGVSVVAIDQSEAMIQKARKKNAQASAVEFIKATFLDTDFPDASFDKIIAFNVNFFWKNPEKELMLIRRLLKPKGELYFFYQAPYEIDLNIAGPVLDSLKHHSFKLKKKVLKTLKPSSAIALIAVT